MATKKKETAEKPADNAVMNVIRKIGLLGVGIASLTKEKAEKITSDLVKKGNITQEEGRKLTKELIDKSIATKRDLEKKVDTELKKAMNSARFAKESDMKKLEKKVAELEKRVGAAKKK
ncbi:MAG: hypothetical protein ABIG84_06895 [archaeon]